MSANFTPVFGGYRQPGAFKFWCQKVLPLVYDDSLSYYELLCKVVDYINNLIHDNSETIENMDALLNAYNQLQDYVNTYFANLDITSEISDKLDQMADDGTLSHLIEPVMDELTEFIRSEAEVQQVYNEHTRETVTASINSQTEYNMQTRETVESEIASQTAYNTATRQASESYNEYTRNIVGTQINQQNLYNQQTRNMLSSAYGAPIPVVAESDIPNGENIVVWIGGNTTGASGTDWLSGHWYYVAKEAGVITTTIDGGVFQSTALQTDKSLTRANTAADSKSVGDRLRFLAPIYAWATGSKINRLTGAVEAVATGDHEHAITAIMNCVDRRDIPGFESYTEGLGGEIACIVCLYDENETYLGAIYNNASTGYLNPNGSLEPLASAPAFQKIRFDVDITVYDASYFPYRYQDVFTVRRIGTDKYLKDSNIPADAKVVGDEITNLKQDNDELKSALNVTEKANNILTNVKQYFGQYCKLIENVPLISGHNYKIYVKSDKAVGVNGDIGVQSSSYVSITSEQLLAGYEWDYNGNVTGNKYIVFHSDGQGDTTAKITIYVEDLTLNHSYSDGLFDTLSDRTDRRFKESLVFSPTNFIPFAGQYNSYLKDIYLNNNYRSVLIKNFGIVAVKVDSVSQQNCPPIVFFSGIPSPSTFMGYYGNAGSITTYKDEIVLIPDGVEYIAVNTYNDSSTPLKIEIATNKETIVGDLYTYTVQDGGGYSTVTKEWYANANFKAALISCSEGDIFVITTVTNGSNHLALAYSGDPSESTFIMNFLGNGNNLTYYEDAIVVAPKGCTKMAINGYLSNDLVIKQGKYQYLSYGDSSESTGSGFEAKIVNDVLTVKPNRAYDGKMISVVMKRRGGNNLFDFDSITAIGENSTVEIETNVTDWIMPYKIQAMIDNPGGDNQGSYYFTGGNHRSSNASTGGVVTGVCDYLKYFIDGVETTDFNGICNEVRVEWQNRVTAFNTTREDGNGTLVLQCKHILTISNGKFKVRTILTPLVNIKMLQYYGYAMHCSGNDCYVRYIGSQENRKKTAIETESNSGGKTTVTLSIEKGVYHMDLTLDKKLDMGRGNYAANKDVDAFTAYNKMYWWVVGSDLLMDEGEQFYVDAVYRFY